MEASNVTREVYWQLDTDGTIFAELEPEGYGIDVEYSVEHNWYAWKVTVRYYTFKGIKRKIVAHGVANTEIEGKWLAVKAVRRELVEAEVYAE